MSATSLLRTPFDGVCPFEPACHPKADDFRTLAPPKFISIKQETGWRTVYANREEGGGLMS